MPGNFYHLSDKLVYIKDIQVFGSENRVIMIEEDNPTERVYIGSTSDIFSDFESSNDSFDINKPTTIPSKKSIIVKKPQATNNETYDIVYYLGNKKIETIRTNIPKGLAYGLSKKLMKEAKYKGGEIRVVKNNINQR